MITNEQKLKFQIMNHYQLNAEFIDACWRGNIDLVKYLLTSHELIEYINIHVEDNEALAGACRHSKLDVVQYLLTSSDLKNHANIHNNDDEIFVNACRNERTSIIQYLIFNFHIEETKHIKNYLTKYNRKDIINMFEKRKLEQELQKNLIYNKNTNHHKIKL